MVSGCGGVSLRLGLIYGPDARGMGGTLARLAKLPVIPVPGGKKSYQFLLHSADLGPAIEQAIVGHAKGVVGVANPDRVLFTDVIRKVGGSETRSAFVSVPWRPIHRSMRLAERLKMRLPLRSDSLLGLTRAASYVPNVQSLGIRYR